MTSCDNQARLVALVAGELGGAEADALAQHVAGCPFCAEALARLGAPPAGSAGAPPEGGPATSACEAPGLAEAGGAEGDRVRRLPGYEILGELGRGGMGVVYKARQVGANRLVALKMILADEHASAAERARFRTEVEAVARLAHPNVVQVYEVGEHEGKPFFSLEYCPGGSLEGKLAGTPQPPAEAARLVEVLARAVQAAHERQVVHRDLKPANVLLLEDGTPKITDFGLARKLDEAGQTAASYAVLGTASYMAPEQARGKVREVGPAADVYALGAILYECLTGRPPFKAASLADTLLQVIGDEPVPVRRLQPKVPADLETVCLKCLHKEAGRRYASAAELADDLGRFVAGEPIRARPVGGAGAEVGAAPAGGGGAAVRAGGSDGAGAGGGDGGVAVRPGRLGRGRRAAAEGGPRAQRRRGEG
jgi:tRNA A-37 threonylcarbamoyl transferase component Bud32